jgi:hypothetical protein
MRELSGRPGKAQDGRLVCPARPRQPSRARCRSDAADEAQGGRLRDPGVDRAPAPRLRRLLRGDHEAPKLVWEPVAHIPQRRVS